MVSEQVLTLGPRLHFRCDEYPPFVVHAPSPISAGREGGVLGNTQVPHRLPQSLECGLYICWATSVNANCISTFQVSLSTENGFNLEVEEVLLGGAGYMCTTWWLLSLVYGCLPATLFGFEAPESPGVRLSREGVTALHPVVLVPGIVIGGLELWEGRSCAEGLFRKRLWGDSFVQILKRPLCWLEHLSLHDETGLDPPGIRVRAVPGLVAADNFASGYLLWADLIENLARIGYEGRNLFMSAYDWRLSFQNTEIRDQALSRLKSHIELMFVTNGYKKVVVVPQSMGAIYFLHFLKWVETPPPMGGGGGGPGWCDKYIKAIMNISPAFLGDPRAVSNIFSTEGSVTFVRALASGILNFDYLGRQTLERVMRVCRTWDSIISLMPKGGETIWGGLDWCLEQWNTYDQVKKEYVKHFASSQLPDSLLITLHSEIP
ncbi:putative phospholipid:diacylglycerol acyltransferase 2 [Glycine soja]|uniref:putative phospholipid:diacylglycerol acyltransferase 2 n=1 Tax=Glycine soja TaxID=3848 RepID=UPI00103AC15F|nr:putative phospholipid:diacylglycerol acyltransferase 2 [Glycine soja]